MTIYQNQIFRLTLACPNCGRLGLKPGKTPTAGVDSGKKCLVRLASAFLVLGFGLQGCASLEMNGRNMPVSKVEAPTVQTVSESEDQIQRNARAVKEFENADAELEKVLEDDADILGLSQACGMEAVSERTHEAQLAAHRAWLLFREADGRYESLLGEGSASSHERMTFLTKQRIYQIQTPFLQGWKPPIPGWVKPDTLGMSGWEHKTFSREEFQRVNAELAKVFEKSLTQQSSPQHREALIAAHRAWLSFRDADANYEFLHAYGGSGRSIFVNERITYLTWQRIYQLQTPFAQGWKETTWDEDE